MPAPCTIDDVSDLINLFTDPANEIQRITIESEWTPPIVMEKPLAGPSSIGPWEKLLKPKITVDLASGAPLIIAPAGAPGESKWLLLAIPAGLAAGGALFFSVVGLSQVLKVLFGKRTK